MVGNGFIMNQFHKEKIAKEKAERLENIETKLEELSRRLERLEEDVYNYDEIK